MFGVVFGGSASHSNSDQHSGSDGSGSQSSNFSSSMRMSIELSFGLCEIHRPWLLREIFCNRRVVLAQRASNAWSATNLLPGRKARTIASSAYDSHSVADELDYTTGAGYSDERVLPPIGLRVQLVQCAEAEGSWVGGTVSRSNADWSGDLGIRQQARTAGSCNSSHGKRRKSLSSGRSSAISARLSRRRQSGRKEQEQQDGPASGTSPWPPR